MKKMIGFVMGGMAGLAVLVGAYGFTQKVDSAEAQAIALQQAGGGEIIAQEISNEGLWNEYSYTVQNNNTWYEIDINGFGHVEEVESGTGDSWKY